MKFSRLKELIEYNYPKSSLISELGWLPGGAIVKLHHFKNKICRYKDGNDRELNLDELFELATILATGNKNSKVHDIHGMNIRDYPFWCRFTELTEAFDLDRKNSGAIKMFVFGALKHMKLLTRENFERLMNVEHEICNRIDFYFFFKLVDRLPFHQADFDEVSNAFVNNLYGSPAEAERKRKFYYQQQPTVSNSMK